MRRGLIRSDYRQSKESGPENVPGTMVRCRTRRKEKATDDWSRILADAEESPSLRLTFGHFLFQAVDSIRYFGSSCLDSLEPLQIIHNLVPHIAFFMSIGRVIFDWSPRSTPCCHDSLNFVQGTFRDLGLATRRMKLR